MKFDNQCGLEGGWAFLSRVTGRPMNAVQWLGRRIEMLMDQDWSSGGIRRLIAEDIVQQPWQW